MHLFCGFCCSLDYDMFYGNVNTFNLKICSLAKCQSHIVEIKVGLGQTENWLGNLEESNRSGTNGLFMSNCDLTYGD